MQVTGPGQVLVVGPRVVLVLALAPAVPPSRCDSVGAALVLVATPVVCLVTECEYSPRSDCGAQLNLKWACPAVGPW